jgi:hypothetical protein
MSFLELENEEIQQAVKLPIFARKLDRLKDLYDPPIYRIPVNIPIIRTIAMKKIRQTSKRSFI